VGSYPTFSPSPLAPLHKWRGEKAVIFCGTVCYFNILFSIG